MRVSSNGKWAFASRDLFKAMECEHCVKLSMAVKAGEPEVSATVKPYAEDLNQKLHIIQGLQRERIVFDQIKASLPAGHFLELQDATLAQTIDALNELIPVVAQGYLADTFEGYEWTGYADLLVLEGYEIQQDSDGTIKAGKVGPSPSTPKYTPWDVKNSSKGEKKHQVQIAAYLLALQSLGLASQEELGIVLGFSRGIVRFDIQESVELFETTLARLVAVLNAASPQNITEQFIEGYSCSKKSICERVYCDYPKLCEKTFEENRVLELLHNIHHTHAVSLRSAGIADLKVLAAFESAPAVPNLKPEFSERYWQAAQLMQREHRGQKVLMSKISGSPQLPEPTAEDFFFDVEWFNYVDSSRENIFMFGVVDSAEKFDVFVAEEPTKELQAFDEFLDYGMKKLTANPDMHIYHFHNPEPKKVALLVERYRNHRQADAEALMARMIDLKTIVTDAFVPGSGSYSIKALERYYDADSKLNRGGLVAGGADAMYQFELVRQALIAGDAAEGAVKMAVIAAYNKDDCLSTKLLADWLRDLNFEEIGAVRRVSKF